MQRGFKYIAQLAIFIFAISFALPAHAAFCSAKGYAVVFINGVFDTRDQADEDATALQIKLNHSFNGELLTVITAYNQTHLAKLGDLVEMAFPVFGSYDLNTMLLQIYPEVTTRKLLLVGHSQGAAYANRMYDYLVAHGEPQEALGVYAVATPEAGVAGNGLYLTYKYDSVINTIRGHGLFNPLPGNIDYDNPIADSLTKIPGHSFTDSYLASASNRIVSEIDGELAALKPSFASAQGDCFTPPPQNLSYKLQGLGLALADPLAGGLVVGGGAVVDTTVAAAHLAYTASASVAQAFGGALAFFSSSTSSPSRVSGSSSNSTSTPPRAIEQGFNIYYGTGLTPQEVRDLSGAAVVLAADIATSSGSGPADLSSLYMGGQTAGTSTGTSTGSQTVGIYAGTAGPELEPPDISAPPQSSVEAAAHGSDTLPAAPAPTPPVPTVSLLQIIINEVSWGGSLDRADRQWIELKNLGTTDIDLSHLTLVALDGGSQYIPLSGTVYAASSGLNANTGFYLVELNGGIFIPDTWGLPTPALAASSDALSQTGEQLALTYFDGTSTTTLDTTPPIAACSGWCGGQSATAVTGNSVAGDEADVAPEAISMERVNAVAAGTLASNWASNDMYKTYPNHLLPLFGTPGMENSSHLPDSGYFCSPDTAPITDGQKYNPQEDSDNSCTYLTRFIALGLTRESALYAGVVGSSTQLHLHNVGELTNNNSLVVKGVVVKDATYVKNSHPNVGDPFFIEIHELRQSSALADEGAFFNYFSNGSVAAPHTNFRVVSWVYAP